MIKLHHIDHININVKNLKETVQFYKKFFDFDVLEEGKSNFSGGAYAIIGKTKKALLAIYESSDQSIFKKGFVNHFGFHIENFDEALHRLKDQGVELLYGGVNQYPNSRSIYIADPNGIEIELSEKFGGGL